MTQFYISLSATIAPTMHQNAPFPTQKSNNLLVQPLPRDLSTAPHGAVLVAQAVGDGPTNCHS